tara:strand:+ start:53606 stop:54019 length:414 start_codon:yes stop_codon:yes gene_type:complete
LKDLLTTTSSTLIILFCFSLFFLGEEPGSDREGPALISHHIKNHKSGTHPLAKTTLFQKVQSVRLKKGVLMFVTSDEEGLKEHFFLIRDKNVVLIKKKASDMPLNSIKFEDDGHNTLLVTIPNSFEIDLLEEMTSLY